ncbi:hypothetical protein BJ875DRAFT_496402 [Amylocarpus encephaloides]|uniref:Uncharacterized protein n=1 Tax=Amylocarpus encephaloides TaxID=45428 RepID=A0A9P7YHM9_9HELO|nr:hypothetical protein BJ875DRAFT_496402 [Amylocarpus encephaloides]
MATYPSANLIPGPLSHSGTTYSLNHRDSLTNPPHQTLHPEEANPMSSFFRFHGRGRGRPRASPPPAECNEDHEGLPQHNEDHESRSPHWMSEFCTEPPSDSKHGALAVFLPCVLFSKTHWRLKRFLSNQNGFDSNWRGKDGCNLHCWAICLLAFVIPILTFVPIMALRASVRGMYGIEGSLANDYVISFFCPECVLVQIDREVRAREGQRELRNGKKFKNYQQEDLEMGQPSPQPQMAYVPQREASDASDSNNVREGQNIEPLATTTTGSSAPSTQGILQNFRSQKGKVRNNNLSREAVMKQNGTRRSKLSSLHFTEGEEDGEDLLALGTTSGCELDSSPPESTCSTPTEDESRNIRITVSQHVLQDCNKITDESSSLQHDLEECAQTPAEGSHAGAKKISQHELISCEQKSLSGPTKHTQEDCIHSSGSSGEDSSPSQHSLAECGTGRAVTTPNRHALSVCENSNQSISNIHPLRQHDLTDVDSGSSTSGARALGLDTCGKSNQTGARKRVLSQHRLKDRSSQSNAGSSENHSLVACEDPNKIRSQKGRSSSIHSLPGCGKISQNKYSLSQHNLEDCASQSGISGLEWHTLAACEDSNRVKGKGRLLDDHDLSDCETGKTGQNEGSQPEDRLSACVPGHSLIDLEMHAINTCEDAKGDNDNKDGRRSYRRTRIPKSENRPVQTRKDRASQSSSQEVEQSAKKSLAQHLTKKGHTVGPSQIKKRTSNKPVARRVRSEEKHNNQDKESSEDVEIK